LESKQGKMRGEKRGALVDVREGKQKDGGGGVEG